MDNTGEFAHRSIIHLLLEVAQQYAHRKRLPSRHSQCEGLYTQKATLNRSLLCLNLTDYLTFKTDFMRLVEFSQWVRENYPDKVPLNTESK